MGIKDIKDSAEAKEWEDFVGEAGVILFLNIPKDPSNADLFESFKEYIRDYTLKNLENFLELAYSKSRNFFNLRLVNLLHLHYEFSTVGIRKEYGYFIVFSQCCFASIFCGKDCESYSQFRKVGNSFTKDVKKAKGVYFTFLLNVLDDGAVRALYQYMLNTCHVPSSFGFKTKPSFSEFNFASSQYLFRHFDESDGHLNEPQFVPQIGILDMRFKSNSPQLMLSVITAYKKLASDIRIEDSGFAKLMDDHATALKKNLTRRNSWKLLAPLF